MNGEKKKASVRRGTEASAVTLRFAIDLAKPNEESTTNEFSYELLRKRELEEKKVCASEWCGWVRLGIVVRSRFFFY